MLIRRLFLPYVFLLPLILAAERQPERILDVRQVIKDALDIMRSYPAPTQLLKTVRQSQPAQPQQLQESQQQPLAGYYAQQHQSYYPPHRAYGATTYNGGVVSQVDRRFGAKSDSEPNYAAQVSRLFATPTQQDMEKLFHLPADIMHRLAADAGYITPSEDTSQTESTAYKSSDQSFNFNIQGNGGPAQSLNSFISSLQNQPETSTQPPVVDVPGPPHITTRQVLRDGKYMSIPILIIPQKNGENIYVPFSDMQELSDAVNKIISTGHYELTTPKNPDEDKVSPVFPVPGPMPTVNIEIEPPAKPVNLKRVQQTAQKIKTNGSSFIQLLNTEDENTNTPKSEETEVHSEEINVTKAPELTNPVITIATTKPTVSPFNSLDQSKKKVKSKEKKQDEIVLNGQRYKLVAVESSVSSETSTINSASNERESESKRVKITETKSIRLDPTNVTEEEVLPMKAEQRQYSLKELEEIYNRRNALATQAAELDDSLTSMSQRRQQIIEMRDRFARERAELAKQTKKVFMKTKETVATNESDNNRCVFLRAFARRYGVVDVGTFASNNCKFIESSFPDLKCQDIVRFIADCKF